MRKLTTQRIAILIDADNLEIFARQTFERHIDYRALWDAMNGREIVRAIYFKPRECPARLRTFLDKGLGIEVQLPPKNVDTYLSIAGVTLAERVDAIALCCGDSDYVPLTEYLRCKGCKSEVWCFPGATSPKLRETADEFRPLDEGILLPMLVKPAPANVSPIASILSLSRFGEVPQ